MLDRLNVFLLPEYESSSGDDTRHQPSTHTAPLLITGSPPAVHLPPPPVIIRSRSRSSARSFTFSPCHLTYHRSLGVPVCAPAPGYVDAAVRAEAQNSRYGPFTSLPASSGDTSTTAMLENDNGMHSTSAPANFPIEHGMVTSEEFRRYLNESWGLHQRHMRDAHINSASLFIPKRQVEGVNENLNEFLRRLNRWARSLRVNYPVRNIGRTREAVVDVVERVAATDPCSDGDSDTEIGYNMWLVSVPIPLLL